MKFHVMDRIAKIICFSWISKSTVWREKKRVIYPIPISILVSVSRIYICAPQFLPSGTRAVLQEAQLFFSTSIHMDIHAWTGVWTWCAYADQTMKLPR